MRLFDRPAGTPAFSQRPLRGWVGTWACPFLLAVAACAAGHGPYTWVDDYPPAKVVTTGYVIGVGDLLSIQVWQQENLSSRERVRPDGNVSIPLVGEVLVVGRAPADVAHDLEKLLKERNFVLDPRVSVNVEEVKPMSIAVLGKLVHPGTFNIEPGAGVAEALASAGGLTDFAHKDQIYVIRRTPKPVKVRFSYEQLTSQTGSAPLFRLRSGDVIVVY